jgi:hypothetical protein
MSINHNRSFYSSIKKKDQKEVIHQIFIYLAKRSTIPAASTLRNKHICCSLGGTRSVSSIDVVSGSIDLTTTKKKKVFSTL